MCPSTVSVRWESLIHCTDTTGQGPPQIRMIDAIVRAEYGFFSDFVVLAGLIHRFPSGTVAM